MVDSKTRIKEYIRLNFPQWEKVDHSEFGDIIEFDKNLSEFYKINGEEIILISYTNISITGTERLKPQFRVFLNEYKKPFYFAKKHQIRYYLFSIFTKADEMARGLDNFDPKEYVISIETNLDNEDSRRDLRSIYEYANGHLKGKYFLKCSRSNYNADINQASFIYIGSSNAPETKYFEAFVNIFDSRPYLDSIYQENNIQTSDNITTDQPRQQIFYGAPGTGKSHEIKKTTDTMPVANVFRTTFHPDSDYSTFVGCYKPTMVSHERLYSQGELISKLTEIKKSGVTYPVHKFSAKYWESLKELTNDETKAILTACGFTDSMNVEVGKGIAIGQELAGHSENKKITYEFVPQAFLKAYKRAHETDETVVLVIEEINRGNCAQIFGDLFQLLDRKDGVSEYPIDADEDLRKYLIDTLGEDSPAIANGKLCLPPNLYIWATMNTSDQSLFPIDSAFKRRWDWQYIPIKRADKEPENKWIIKVTHNDKTYWCYWWEFLETINHQIEETTHSEDKQLGYFFAKPKAGENFIPIDTFVNKVIFYLWNDVFKDEDSAVFQYDNNKVEDVSISRSGTMYFRHFIENKDEMIHYFINQLFAMGKDNTPVVPIDYFKYDNDPTVIEHLPKMREDRDETPMPKIGNNKEEGDADGKNGRNTDKYIVDGTAEQIHKKQLLEKIVKKQIEQNPNITIEELKGCWDDISLNSQPCVLSEEEYQKLIKENPSYEGRYNQVNNGIWVNNQIGGEDTALKIIEKAESLGVSVEIVKK